ncbi:MAG TPA: glycerol-3-phosphate dehydrogenase C-terminal domain-containing protein, partial [Gemmatimonadales bacterium]|nr:glycerol-3-phosphate dehydrogenase C-terminal domain-containing protein [Gemmatimonadales bacterium]
ELWAEVRHAVEREMAVRLADVLVRRLHLFHETRDHGAAVAAAVASFMARVLDWDEAREAGEVAAYQATIKRAKP